MTDQLALFGTAADPLPVRSTDPETSRAAASALPLRARQQEVVDALRTLGCTSTPDEVLTLLRRWGLDRERNEVASRLSELERMDPPMARKVGVRQGRRGRPVATWKLTNYALGLTG